jgi:pyrophosphatase PpaX
MVFMEFKNKLSQKKLFIFDLDGTIVKLKVDWSKLKKVLEDRFSNLYEESCEFESVSTCLSYIVSKNDKEELLNFIDIIRDFELNKIETTEIIPETVNFIQNPDQFGISENVKFAVLSLNTRETIRKSLKIAGIENKFEMIVGREDVRRWKPEPEGLVIIQRYFNIENDKMVYFGDQKKDVITGKNAGIDAYFIDDLIDFVKEQMKNK